MALYTYEQTVVPVWLRRTGRSFRMSGTPVKGCPRLLPRAFASQRSVKGSFFLALPIWATQ